MEPPVASPWVSFVAEDGDTWLFDLSFFASNWRCIYGNGCAGIEERRDVAGQRGCCSYGAHFADAEDLRRVMEIAAALPADIWQFNELRPEVPHEPEAAMAVLVDALTEVDEEGDRTTRVIDGACVFLNRPDHTRGAGCAIHVAAEATGIDPLEWKPEVCWQVPIRVEHHEDDNGGHTHFVRQWTRRDWGEAGADLAWWCSEASEAYSGSVTTAEGLRAEIAALAGAPIADALIDWVRSGTGVRVELGERRGD